MNRFSLILGAFLSFLSVTTTFGQIVGQTDFEQFTATSSFTKTSWETAGFTVPWVNGFNQSRAIVDGQQSVSGTKSMRLYYPKDQYGPSNTGGQAPLLVTPQDEYYTSYSVRFSDDFSWGSSNEGGKLPGLSGGGRCSGCAVCTGDNGFTARLMWRTGGKAVVYLYHLNKVNPPCGDNYEIMVDGKNLVFEKGKWYKISQRVKVNSGTNSDGEVEMWIDDKHAQIKLYNGTLVEKLTGIQFVNNGDKVDGLYFSTFHGGGDNKWVPTVDSYAWFDDVIISRDLKDVVKPITGIDATIENKEVVVYPNPTDGKVNLPSHISTWTVYDQVGKAVLNGEGTSIDFSQLKKGMYVIKSGSYSANVVKE